MLTVGSKLGHYDIVGLIGAGGMGEVYRGRDSKLDRDVAIKVLPALAAADAEQLARFTREAHVLASLSHPNIAAIYGLEDAADQPALVLELVEGSTLANRLAHGPLPILEALAVAQQIAAALQAAHEQGIVHRDLKPGNVIVRADGVVKVLDFGLAKLSDTGTTADMSKTPAITTPATRQGSILGTPAYMSPEQVAGRPIDKSADVWAFGAVLYEMLTGQRAFPGSETAEVLASVLRDEPRWAFLPPETPSSVLRLVRRCLVKDVRERLHDLGDARLEIEDGLSASPSEKSATFQAPSTGKTRRALMGGLVVLLVVIAAALGALADRFLSTGPAEDRRAANSTLPLVIMMDSAHPRRVYDEQTLAASGTNADVISDLLADLPIRRQKETIGPDWHRDEEIRQFRPDLILIHYSGFNQEDDQAAPRTRLRIFLQFLADTPVRFIIYSRTTDVNLNANLSTLLGDLYIKHDGLQERIRAFGLLDYGPPRWINTVTGTQLKIAVKEVLRLP